MTQDFQSPVAAEKVATRKHPLLTFFSIIGITEGCSSLVLFFIAMPLKYFFENPTWVRPVGAVHGGLFLLYVGAALVTAQVLRWPWSRVFWAFIASIFPFGPFVFEAWLRCQKD